MAYLSDGPPTAARLAFTASAAPLRPLCRFWVGALNCLPRWGLLVSSFVSSLALDDFFFFLLSRLLPLFGLLSSASSPGQALRFRRFAEPCLTSAPSAGATLFLSLAIVYRRVWAGLVCKGCLYGLMSDAMGGRGSAGLRARAGVAEGRPLPGCRYLYAYM